jgi:hypothetical protein
VLSSAERVKNQITGYFLNGFSSSSSTSISEGPAVGSCPTGWTAINLVQEEPVVASGGGLKVNGVVLQ